MITLHQVTKQFGPHVVYDRVSAAFHHSHRTAVIGPNGAGKTLLLRVIMGEESVDSGDVVVPPDLRLGYLPQELAIEGSQTPQAYVLQPFAHLLEIENACEDLARTAGDGSAEYRRAAAELTRLQAEQRVHDAYSLPSRAMAVLAGLGIDTAMAQRDMRELSGGFRMRVVLARLLLSEPDMLLLDEPTNHLDMDSLIWLERFLLRFRGGMLVVSHDRDFLGRVTDHTAELRAGALRQYNGTVAGYLAWRETHAVTEERRAANIRQQIAQTERFIERFKAKNTKASAARSKEKALARLQAQLPAEDLSRSSAPRFRLAACAPSGAVPLLIEGLHVAYGEKRVLTDLSMTVTRGQRVAIVGPNGAGKSTLLKAVAGLVAPQAGTVKLGYNTELRYFSQHRLEQLDPRLTVYDTIAQVMAGAGRNAVQSLLGAFMFSGDDVEKSVGVLSGGEKSRLSLAVIMARPGNLLLLDEPTNHLDIESVERLAEVLEGFTGTLVVVSHDEYLLTRVATRVVEMRPGAFRDFPGALAEYRSYVEAGFLESFEQATGAGPVKAGRAEEERQERKRQRNARVKLEREIARVEAAVASREKTMDGLRQDLLAPGIAADYASLHELNERLEQETREHERLLAEWERLQERLAGLKPE